MDSSRVAVRELNQIGRVGRLDLTFGLRNGRTAIREIYSEVPHKVTHLYYPDQSSLAQVILMNTTAGLFGGDRSEVRIHVEKGARVVVTSQASLKVHPGDGWSEQSLNITVEPGAEMHFVNDPLIPFRGARLRQRVSLQAGEGSLLAYWDGFMAGRVSRGERWEFETFDAETRLAVSGRVAYLERYCLTPSSSLPDQWVTAGMDYTATALFYGFGAPDPAIATPTTGLDQPYPGLVVARVVAQSGTHYRNAQRSILNSFWKQQEQPLPDLRK
jgi:urease accessory protein